MRHITGSLLITSGLILILSGFSQSNIGITLLMTLLGLGLAVTGYKIGGFNERV